MCIEKDQGAWGQGYYNIPSLLYISNIILISDFLPFGTAHGDTRVPTIDDGSTGGIQLGTDVIIFGTRQNRLYVSCTRTVLISKLQLFKIIIIGKHEWCDLIWRFLYCLFFIWLKF